MTFTTTISASLGLACVSPFDHRTTGCAESSSALSQGAPSTLSVQNRIICTRKCHRSARLNNEMTRRVRQASWPPGLDGNMHELCMSMRLGNARYSAVSCDDPLSCRVRHPRDGVAAAGLIS
jgi:hypothetical protein